LTVVLQLPRLYCILDAACFQRSEAILSFARQLLAAGATLIQYRNKQGSDREILRHARELRRIVELSQTMNGEPRTTLIMNDRSDLALAGAFDGVHVGQDDLSPAAARRVIGAGRLLGVSTHDLGQLRAAAQTDCDYIAIGPVFTTASKKNPDPCIGLEGVRAARALLNQLPESSRKPLVAIGGITQANCASVIAAGADSVAVISGLLRSPQNAVREFLEALGS
jgi:thiamine-phosphate pyrophosphorylase